MASLLMVKTKRRQSSPEAVPDRPSFTGYNGRKPLRKSVDFLNEHGRKGSIFGINNNNNLKSDENDSDISKALDILRMQRRESMAQANYNEGENGMMIPKTIEIVKKLRSNSSYGLSSSAPNNYMAQDQGEMKHVPRGMDKIKTQRNGSIAGFLSTNDQFNKPDESVMNRVPGEMSDIKRQQKRRGTIAAFMFGSDSNFDKQDEDVVTSLPRGLNEPKAQRRGTIAAFMLGDRTIREEDASDMSPIPAIPNRMRTHRSGSIAEALMSHAGHLDVMGHSEMKPFHKDLERLKTPRRGSISNAIRSHSVQLDNNEPEDNPVPRAMQGSLKAERSGSIAEALIAYGNKNNNNSGGLKNMRSLKKEIDNLKTPRRSSSPGALRTERNEHREQNHYFSNEDDMLKPKTVAMLRQSRRNTDNSADNSDHLNYYGAAELDQPMRYSSKLMNSIWGRYNEYSVHNFKSLQCDDVSFSCPEDADESYQQTQKNAGSNTPTHRGKLQKRLGELGEAVAANFMDNLNRYY